MRYLSSKRESKRSKSVCLVKGIEGRERSTPEPALSALQARTGTTRGRRPGIIPSKGYEPKYVIRPRPDVRKVFKTAVIEK